MKQPFASAARLRGDGPILLAASEPTVRPGHRHLGSSTAIRENPSGRRTACLSFLADRLRPAGATRSRLGFRRPDHAPERDEQLSGERHDHLRPPRGGRTFCPRAVPPGERTVKTSRARPIICRDCWMTGKLDRLQSAHAQRLPVKQRADIRRDDRSPFQRFTTQKTRLNSTLKSKHVISGK